jgi:hypothetical protein
MDNLFGDLPIGTRFLDYETGYYYTKNTDTTALAMQHGMEVEDEFDADEVVELEGADMPHSDESMDGDFDSAMASAGLGTDEDYGYYGGEDM